MKLLRAYRLLIRVRLSACLSVCGLPRTGSQLENKKKRRKIRIGTNIPRSTSKWSVNLQLKRSKIKKVKKRSKIISGNENVHTSSILRLPVYALRESGLFLLRYSVVTVFYMASSSTTLPPPRLNIRFCVCLCAKYLKK